MSEDEYLTLVNSLLKDAPPVGAYCLGTFEAERRKAKLPVPDADVLRRVASCKSVEEGDALFISWRDFERLS